MRVVSSIACHEKSDDQQKKYVRCLQSVIGRFTGSPYEYLSQLTVFICIIRVVSGVVSHVKLDCDQKKFIGCQYK